MQKLPDSDLNRLDGMLVVTAAGASLIIYVMTLAPGLLPGDSGEFQALAYLLGNTHPTGYSVYLILARLFIFLPLGEIAYRVNLFSAVMAAAAVAGVYLLARSLSGYRATALIIALALAISPTFWSQAIIAEVYTAGAAFLVFVLLALIGWQRSGSPTMLFLGGLMGGLSLGVHLTVALLAPAAMLSILATAKQSRAVWLRVWLPALVGALTGTAITILSFLLLYRHHSPADFFNSAVIPARSSWGLAAADIDGPWEQLLFHWSAQQFRRFMFANPAEVMTRQAIIYWNTLPLQVAPAFLALALVGLISMLIRSRQVAWLLLMALAAQWLFTFNYDIWDLYVFHIPSYLLLLVLAAAGIGTAIDLLRRFARQRPISGWPYDLALAALMAVLGLWPVLRPNLAAIGRHQVPFRSRLYPVNDSSLHRLLPMARQVIEELPDNAILFTNWDMLYPYYYVAHIELERSDLMFIETYPNSNRPGLATSTVSYVAQHLTAHPIYFTDRPSAITRAGYRFISTQIGPLRLHRVGWDQ